MRQDGAVESDDVVPFAHHHAPPVVLQVPLQFRAERTKIPHAVKSAVDFCRLENEPPPLAKADDSLHSLRICLFLGAHRGNNWDSTSALANELRHSSAAAQLNQ